METVVKQAQLQAYYAGKKVLVTGHTGFKGAWLAAVLHMLGATVKGYALPPEYPQGLFNLLPQGTIAESIIADIRDRKTLSRELLSFKPDYIFHLAAQPLVRRSYAIPAETFEINVIGTANLLEAMQQLQASCTAVIITTDKVYDNKEQDILYREEDMLGGYDPYSASKACTEIVVSAFRNSFFNVSDYGRHHKAIASARAGNVIGGGDWSADRIIPDIVRALQQDQVIPVRNPGSVRPWQHVLEPVTGYLQLGGLLHDHPQNFARAYNFGPWPQDHLTVKELAEIAIKVWGQGSWADMSNPTQPHEARWLQLDINRAVNELQWKPRLTASQAIAWTLEWYRQPVAGQGDFTFRQIKNYLAL